MKHVLLRIFVAVCMVYGLLLTGGCATKSPWLEEVAAPAVVFEVDDPVPELWFKVGERLRYKAYWGIIPVAESRVTTEWVKEDDRRLLAIRFRTKSNNYLRKIYPIDDLIESIIDPITFLPVRFTKRISEGRYRADETTTFDYEFLRAVWRKNLTGETREYAIEADTRDIVSFMYFMRQVPFELGKPASFRVMSDEKLYDLSVTAKKIQRVKTVSNEKISSVRLEPKASFEGLFVRKGEMTLWVSQDERRIVTKMVAHIPVVANMKLVLWEYEE